MKKNKISYKKLKRFYYNIFKASKEYLKYYDTNFKVKSKKNYSLQFLKKMYREEKAN